MTSANKVIHAFLKSSADDLIQVSGYGRLSREQIQKKIQSYLKDLADAGQKLNELNLRKIHYLITNGVLKVMVEAEERELKKDEAKKKI